MPENFVHLHVHSHFSLLDGACKIEDLVKRAAEHQMPACAITDHGNMHGVVQFFKHAEKAKIKPIIGYEAYVAPKSRFNRESAGAAESSYHLTLLAENDVGYYNLMKLSTTAYLDGFYYKPRIDKEILAKHSKGLIALSGCLKGEVPRLLAGREVDDAYAAANQYIDILGRDNFFIEIQDNGIDEQQQILEPLCDLAQKLKIGTVATNDIHYMNAEDSRAHDVLLCINTGKTLNDIQRMRFQTNQFYFRSPDEMRTIFGRFKGAIENTGLIAERCNAKIDFKTFHFPIFATPGGKTPGQFLRELCEEGFKKHYPNNPPEARARLEYELSVISQKGFETYFLIVWDLCRFCREKHIPVGTRGSGCSSVVGYCIGISSVEPIHYRLMFERFLDPERKEMPDYDIDLCERRRPEVMNYVREKYGSENVAQIITFGTLGARAAIKDVGRVMGIPLADVNSITKAIPETLHITIKQALEQEPDLRAMNEGDPRINEMFDIAQRVEGLNRNSGKHPAGVVIADRELSEYVALYKQSEGEVTTQWPMDDVAAIGLLKMDLLGLRTLTILDDALALIKHTRGQDIDLDSIPLDDAKTFQIFQNAETISIFQFSSSGIRAMLRDLKPDKVEDLIAANALYRPGPLKGGMVDKFIKCKHNPKLISYDHPIQEECLAESYGVMATQEQVMLMVNKLAGLSMSKALSLVKAISKKKGEVIEATRGEFLEGAVKNNVPKSLAERVFDLIVLFGGYGFNRAHSTAYALLAYKTAYLKAHYPVEFMAAVLTCESDKTETVVESINEVRRMGIELLAPCVNHSNRQFSVENGKIRYGLGAIRGVGEKAAEAIVAARKEHGAFKSFYDFCDTVDLRAVNRQVFDALVKCGAFDCMGDKRAQLALVLDAALRIGASAQQDRDRGQKSLFGGGDPKVEQDVHRTMPDVPEWPESTLLAYERETIGIYLSRHPLASHEALLRDFSTLNAKDAAQAEDGTPVLIGGIIEGLRVTVTKSGRSAGKKMARFILEDLSGSIECVMFAEDYERYAPQIQVGHPAFLRGTITFRSGAGNIQASEVFPFDQVRPKFTESLILAMDEDVATDATYDAVRKILKSSPGRTSVFFELMDAGKLVVFELNGDYKVTVTDSLCAQLGELLGHRSVRIKPNPTRAKNNRPRPAWGNGNRNGSSW